MRAQAQAPQQGQQNAAPAVSPNLQPAFSSTCRIRGKDWLITTSSGEASIRKGTITNISGGAIYLKADGASESQSFDLSKITSFGLGYCD